MKTKSILVLIVLALLFLNAASVGFRRRQPDSSSNGTDASDSSSTDGSDTPATASTDTSPSDSSTPAADTAETSPSGSSTPTAESSEISPSGSATPAAESTETSPSNSSTPAAKSAESSGVGASANGTNASGTPNTAATTTPPENLLILLASLNAASNIDKNNIILANSSFVFDFLNASNATTTGIDGWASITTRFNYPATFLNFISMSVSFIGPCGLHTPHFHLRGNEIALATEGIFYTGFIAENGAPLVVNLLRAGQAILFGRGNIHWMANLECIPAMYVSVYNDDNPGYSNIAQNYFGLPEDVTSPTIDYLDPLNIELIAAHIPQNITLGLAECFETCGLSW